MWIQRKKKQKRRKKITLVIVSLLVVISLIAFSYHQNLKKPVDPDNNQNFNFVIEPGTGIKTIAKNLENADLVKSDNAFYWYIKLNDLDQEILAGNFILRQSMNIAEITETLSNPAVADQISFTILEGHNIRDIDQRLTEANLIEAGEFISATQDFQDWDQWDFLNAEEQASLEYPLEGYLYPDTYFLDNKSFTPEQLINTALRNFQNKFEPYRDLDRNYTTQEFITMASIIETEVFQPEDRRLVSDLLWRRLENQWTIGADITLLYITDDRIITAEELQIDSPYNTRKNLGLPPGPIANPSIDAIDAAYNREPNDYWFYLTTLDTGEVIYSRTNEEHNLNRAKHLQ